jgi:hypothetical protein
MNLPQPPDSSCGGGLSSFSKERWQDDESPHKSVAPVIRFHAASQFLRPGNPGIEYWLLAAAWPAADGAMTARDPQLQGAF